MSKQEFAYLRVQRGDLDHLSGDYDVWLQAYRETLNQTFESIKPYLPFRCYASLDIGSGLGGINVLIYKHYVDKHGRAPRIHLLDGEKDRPVVLNHGQPFNHMEVAASFLLRHGVEGVSFSSPQRLARFDEPFDLIVSFAAWGFHIPVEAYLDYVLAHSHPETVIVVDARRPYAVRDFGQHFRTEVIEHGKKYDRILMRLPG